MAKIDAFLKKAYEIKASDFHLAAGNPPMFRKYGKLRRIKYQELTSEINRALIYEMLTPEQRNRFEENYELDFCYEIEGVARFRGNVLYQRKGIDASFRVVPLHIPTLDELGLPSVAKKALDQHQGLILVTGAAGHGKSTTLAAMLDFINVNRAHHVITVEDPIEFVHPIKNSVINQREIGRDTLSYANALRAVLREDPDVIMVGELRDPETISLALTCASLGILVFGTLHTSSAAKTIDRIIDAFPSDQQGQVRSMLGDSLMAVVAQQLVRTRDGNGRCAANEILLGSPALGNLIREAKISQIASLIQTRTAEGMQTMDHALRKLINEGKITTEAAYEKASDKNLFAKEAGGEGK